MPCQIPSHGAIEPSERMSPFFSLSRLIAECIATSPSVKIAAGFTLNTEWNCERIGREMWGGGVESGVESGVM